MYADKVTGAMQAAMDETNRRRAVQREFNEQHGVEPMTVSKEVRETIRSYDSVAEVVSQYGDETREALDKSGQPIRIEDIPMLIADLEKDMKGFAKAMEFEKAAELRDEIVALRKLIGVSDGRIGQEKRKNRMMRR